MTRPPDLPRILLVSASFGAGHDRAADQIAWRLEANGMIVDRADLVDLWPIGPLVRRAYRTQLGFFPGTWEWLLTQAGRPYGSRMAIRISRWPAARLRRLITPRTVAVVSTYPLASQALGQMRRAGTLGVPAITFLTDMSVHRMWIASGIDAHLAIHPIAANQAAAHGAREVTVVGPQISPAFTAAPSAQHRIQARYRLGLPAHQRLALVATGSWGVGDFERTARDIAATGAAVPVIACGTNEAARTRLLQAGTGIPLGWVEDMPSLIQASDIVVQSGGGMTSLEALACGTPVITYRCLPGHGRTSAAALDASGWIPWVQSPEALAAALTGVHHTRFTIEASPARLVDTVRRIAAIPVPIRNPA